ncbi:MAG TPA: hypothetical protein ENN02_03060 [Halothiobacillus sp.]|nr:hypothetical protein [Halothiobacillus sp.]
MLNTPLIPKDERLSAVIDGEVSEKVVAETIEDLMHDPIGRARFERYGMIGQVMRAEMSDFVVPDLSSRIMARIEAENTMRTAVPDAIVDDSKPAGKLVRLFGRGQPGRWQLPIGVALVASVLMVAFVLLPVMKQVSDVPASGIQAASTPALTADSQQVVQVSAASDQSVSMPGWAFGGYSSDQPARARIDFYLDPYFMTHFEQTAHGSQVGSVMPGVRLASFQTR